MLIIINANKANVPIEIDLNNPNMPKNYSFLSEMLLFIIKLKCDVNM